MMQELHAQGKSMEEISNSLKTAPIYANSISAIKSTYALGFVLCYIICYLIRHTHVCMYVAYVGLQCVMRITDAS